MAKKQYEIMLEELRALVPEPKPIDQEGVARLKEKLPWASDYHLNLMLQAIWVLKQRAIHTLEDRFYRERGVKFDFIEGGRVGDTLGTWITDFVCEELNGLVPQITDDVLVTPEEFDRRYFEERKGA